MLYGTNKARKRGERGVVWLDNFTGDHLGDLGSDGKTILKWIKKEQDVRMWIEFIWLRIEFSGWHLQTW
jgi:hypothetical protein